VFLNRAAIVAILLQVAIWADNAVRGWLGQYRERREEDPGRATSAAAIGFIARVALWAVIALMILDNLGFNITTLVASLGIGGIAVALAVQNILGDLFASLSIVLDKPFVIGDFINVSGVAGTVEHVGLKTTRVRSLNGEQIVFSNTDLLKSRIHNMKRMDSRRVAFTIGVVYGTPKEQLRMIPRLVENIIRAQPKLTFDRAHFSGFGPSTWTRRKRSTCSCTRLSRSAASSSPSRPRPCIWWMPGQRATRCWNRSVGAAGRRVLTRSARPASLAQARRDEKQKAGARPAF
jgi:small-conductance mechanosensitive channel